MKASAYVQYTMANTAPLQMPATRPCLMPLCAHAFGQGMARVGAGRKPRRNHVRRLLCAKLFWHLTSTGKIPVHPRSLNASTSLVLDLSLPLPRTSTGLCTCLIPVSLCALEFN